MPGYRQGVDDPKFIVDAGSGDWCMIKLPTREALELKDHLEWWLTSDFVRWFRPDAVSHLEHYLGNTGNDYNLNMPDLMKKSELLKKNYNDELALAKTYCETLDTGHHYITSSEFSSSDFADENNSNLFYAMGGYQYWGKGSVKITVIGEGKKMHSPAKSNNPIRPRRRYDLNFSFKLFDRYNWNIEKKNAGVVIGGFWSLSDISMGQLHKECLAREYNVWGVLEQRVIWEDN